MGQRRATSGHRPIGGRTSRSGAKQPETQDENSPRGQQGSEHAPMQRAQKKLIGRQPPTMTERSHPLCGQRAPRRHPSKLRVPEVLKHTQSVVDPVDGPRRALPCSIGAVPSSSWFSSKVEVGASLTRSEPKILAEPGGTP